jgi:hypothetical protein
MKHCVRSTPQARRVATALLLSCSLSLLASVGGAGSNKEPVAACSAVRVGLLQVAKGSEFESLCMLLTCCCVCQMPKHAPDHHRCARTSLWATFQLVKGRVSVWLVSCSYLSPNHRVEVGQVASSLSSFCRTCTCTSTDAPDACTTHHVLQGGAIAAVTTGAHRAALLGADVVVIPEGVGDGPSSLSDFVALALSARVAIVGTYLDSGVDANTNITTTSESPPSLPPPALSFLLLGSILVVPLLLRTSPYIRAQVVLVVVDSC